MDVPGRISGIKVLSAINCFFVLSPMLLKSLCGGRSIYPKPYNISEFYPDCGFQQITMDWMRCAWEAALL